MKKLSLILALVMAIGTIGMLTGCGGSTTNEEPTTTEATTVATTKKTAKTTKATTKALLSRNEAADIAQAHIENKLARGDDITISFGGNQNARTFGTVNYGEASCDYNSSFEQYTIKCKGTCWGYDSYGRAVDKYTFDIKVYVDAESGYASSATFFLN